MAAVKTSDVKDVQQASAEAAVAAPEFAVGQRMIWYGQHGTEFAAAEDASASFSGSKVGRTKAASILRQLPGMKALSHDEIKNLVEEFPGGEADGKIDLGKFFVWMLHASQEDAVDSNAKPDAANAKDTT